ncbi:MAG: dihydrofolate reductase family protein [Marmoricola sp.]
MARFVFSMNQSLDGYIDHTGFQPGPNLFRHFVQEAEAQAGAVYGREMYEVMRYWDHDDPTWDAGERAFATAWRRQPKWVVSRTLPAVGPNATLIDDELEDVLRRIKRDHDGEIEVAGPALAQAVGELGLIDEYRIYLYPVTIGQGKRFFAGRPPRLGLVAHDDIADDVVRLTYLPI